jgi:type VI protein secretion system component VasA
VSVVASQFADSGETRLFGEVLKEFLSQYVSMNSYLELGLILKPSGQTITFSSLPGKQWLI